MTLDTVQAILSLELDTLSSFKEVIQPEVGLIMKLAIGEAKTFDKTTSDNEIRVACRIFNIYSSLHICSIHSEAQYILRHPADSRSTVHPSHSQMILHSCQVPHGLMPNSQSLRRL